MKTFFLLMILFPITSSVFGQTSNIPLGRVEYQEKLLFVNTPENEQRMYSQHNFELYFGYKSSLYIRTPPKLVVKYTQDTDTSGVPKKTLDKIVEQAVAPIKIKSSSSRLKKFDSTRLLTQEITQENEKLIIADTLENIDWKLFPLKTKIIAGYNCNKAIGNFRGRDYEVWYTLAIPVPAGPWKLYGLPGLILEAEDSKHEVIFNTISIDVPPINHLVIPDNFDGKQISENDFIEKDIQQLKKYQNMLRSLNKENKVPYMGTTVMRELIKK